MGAPRVAIVIGGTSGIGHATARLLADQGSRVVIAGTRDEAAGREVAQELSRQGGDVHFARVDVRDRPGVMAFVQDVADRYGRLDGAVNAAGIVGAAAPVASYPEDGFADVFAVNVLGTLACMQAELSVMLPRHSGSIVNVASLAGLRGFPFRAAYAASKHAVVGLTRTAALETAKSQIRINAVCPSFVDTPMIRQQVTDAQQWQWRQDFQPIGRMGDPEEIAHGIVWLLSDAASFMTGAVIPMDGGASA